MSKARLGGSPDIQVQAVLRYVRVGIPHLLAGKARKVLVPLMMRKCHVKQIYLAFAGRLPNANQ